MEAALGDRGVCAESAGHVAASLLEASLRGVDSHGVRLFPHYYRACQADRAPSSAYSPAPPPRPASTRITPSASTRELRPSTSPANSPRRPGWAP